MNKDYPKQAEVVTRRRKRARKPLPTGSLAHGPAEPIVYLPDGSRTLSFMERCWSMEFESIALARDSMFAAKECIADSSARTEPSRRADFYTESLRDRSIPLASPMYLDSATNCYTFSPDELCGLDNEFGDGYWAQVALQNAQAYVSNTQFLSKFRAPRS